MLLRIKFKNISTFQICGLFASSGLSFQELCRQVTSWCSPSRQAHFGNQGTCNRPWEGWKCQQLPSCFQPFCPKRNDWAGRQNRRTCLGIILFAYFESKYNLNSLSMSITGAMGGRRATDWPSAALELDAMGNFATWGETGPFQGTGRAAQARSERCLANCPGPMMKEKWKCWARIYDASPKPFSRAPTLCVRCGVCVFGSSQLHPLTCPFPAWTKPRAFMLSCNMLKIVISSCARKGSF